MDVFFSSRLFTSQRVLKEPSQLGVAVRYVQCLACCIAQRRDDIAQGQLYRTRETHRVIVQRAEKRIQGNKRKTIHQVKANRLSSRVRGHQ